MDEVSSYVRLDLLSARRQGRPKDCSTSSSNPMMEGPWCRFRREARARERHRHVVVDSLKALDPKRPIREADIRRKDRQVRFVPKVENYNQQCVQPATRHPSTWAQQAPRRLG